MSWVNQYQAGVMQSQAGSIANLRESLASWKEYAQDLQRENSLLKAQLAKHKVTIADLEARLLVEEATAVALVAVRDALYAEAEACPDHHALVQVDPETGKRKSAVVFKQAYNTELMKRGVTDPDAFL